MLPPTVGVVLRGVGAVLAASTVVATAVGFVLDDALVALNSVGFIGVCGLSCAVIFYSLGLERSGFRDAHRAATALVTVLAASAVAATVGLLVLLGDGEFRGGASQVGPDTLAGVVVLCLLATIGTVLWRER